MKATLTFAALVASLVSLPYAFGLEIETVGVGNPGNFPDNHGVGTVYGGVSYSYRIGKYEVTNDQYAEFLNAVGQIDTHLLYSSLMASDPAGGIIQSGVSGSFTYAVKPGMGSYPVTAVGAYDAYRFANWLHNGMPSGPQSLTTTEDGAYFLNGVTNPPYGSGSVVNVAPRKGTAKWFVPNENEWYKAAYHQPASDGGDADNYWLYATGSNSNPSGLAFPHDVGADSLASYYGTFDQHANATELTETVIEDGSLQELQFHRTRTGHAFSGANITDDEYVGLGFRVASVVPEPGSLILFAVGLVTVACRPRL